MDLNKYVNRPPLARVSNPLSNILAFRAIFSHFAQVLADYCWFVDRNAGASVVAHYEIVTLSPQKRSEVPRAV